MPGPSPPPDDVRSVPWIAALTSNLVRFISVAWQKLSLQCLSSAISCLKSLVYEATLYLSNEAFYTCLALHLARLNFTATFLEEPEGCFVPLP